MALPSVGVHSVCLRQGGGWTILGVAIVWMVTIVRINHECGLFTSVLRFITRHHRVIMAD